MKQNKWWQGKQGEWYVVVQFLIFGLIAFGPRTVTGWPQWSPAWQQVGTIGGLWLGSFGAALLAAGILNLGKNLTAVPHPKADATLVQSGAYRLVRHPIYSGLILGAYGWAAFRHSWLMLLYATLLFLFFDIKSRREEKWLAAKFRQYPAYQKRVRKLIPYLY